VQCDWPCSLGEIVVDVWAPGIISKSRGVGPKDHGFFVEDCNSGVEGNSDDDDGDYIMRMWVKAKRILSGDEEGDDKEIDEF